ncbi:hypothetical protein H310_14902 [Aphanomyces invadans]|uniref:Uncharacterized protein n=1 Tax=Aphanomyces invadans TaxID=157072 RepID=A0A024T9I7_9STRA|nr:hypothetical protein H310_14902 [Aphanomyces invadans]ETV90281.1 hypothetical protein H310_14902 [Aphanomyces invadans]|eukprot:XP_008881088.1 hypothetical protein H310_14902 [Aphanomyces invadans]
MLIASAVSAASAAWSVSRRPRVSDESRVAKKRKVCTLKDLLRERTDLQDVLRTPELFLVITQFQNGCTPDLQPFGQFRAGYSDKISVLVPQLDHIHRTLTPWYSTHGIVRLSGMFRCLKYMQPIVVLDALAHGKLDVLHHLHTNWRWQLESSIRNEANDVIPIINIAAIHGQVAAVRFLHDRCYRRSTHFSMTGAARHGHFEVVLFLLEHGYPCTDEAMNVSARYGHLDIVKALHMHGIAGCTTDAMDWAAEGGHLDVVRFLHENRREGCTSNAMDWAAEHGHLDIVKFLHFHRTEGCTPDAMDHAASAGHLDVVQFLHTHRTEGCTTDAMNYAAHAGRLQVVQFLHAHRHEGCTTSAMDVAAGDGHLDVVQFLHFNRSEGCTEDAMDTAAWHGHAHVVEFLHEHRTEGASPFAMDMAAAKGHLAIIKFLHSRRTEGFLHSNRTEGCTAYALQSARSSGHTRIVRFLERNGYKNERTLETALSDTRLRNHLDEIVGHILSH